MNRITIGMALVGATLAGPAIAQDLAGYYGFLTPEIYKLDSRSSNLTSVDLNGDGLQDIVIVNNAKSQIDVLLQRRKADDGETSLVGQETNEILSSSRMISRRIPMQRPISTLVVKDVNGDKKPDLVYIGAEPNGLYVEYQNADGTFGDRRSFEIDDAATNSWTVDVGDVNGDGRDDIVFLGKENLYIILQNQQGRLDDPRKFRTSSNNPGLLKVVDLDEDGRVDVIYTTEDPQFPVRLRFQNKQGRLGPEHQLEIERPGAVAYGKLNPAKPGINMLTITQLNARMLCYGLGEAKPKDGAPVSQTMTYPFEKTGAAPNVDLAIADFDGDGKADIAVSDPNGARIMLYRQSEVEGLDLGSPFPAMLGTAALRTIVGADGKPTLLALSTSEKSIGWTRFEGGRLGFPQLAPTKDEPVALEVAGGAKPRLLYVARVEDAANFSEKFILRALTPVEGGGFASAKLGAADELKLDIAARPRDLRAVDANGDGVLDLMIFSTDDEPPTLYAGAKDGGFALAAKGSQGTLGSVAPAAVFFNKLDGESPSLLVAQNAFARKVAVDKEGRWKVVDQYNAPGNSPKVAGVEAIDIDGDGKNELAMYDRASQAVVFMKKLDSGWSRLGQLRVGGLALRGMRVADLNSDGKQDLLLFDADKMSVVYLGKPDVSLDVVATYETDERRGRLFDMIAGDLNHDGRVDLLTMDSITHNLEILAVLPGPKLKRAQRWQVFEEKTFRQQSGRSFEPREMQLGDVNGDGLTDILLLVHDRCLVLLQDAGVEEPAKGIATGGKSPAKSEMKAASKAPTKSPPATASAAGVKDEAGFFKADSVREVNSLASALKTRSGLDFAVETFAEVPPADRVKFQQMTPAEQDQYFARWASKRAQDRGVHGVYVLICRKPGKLRVQEVKSGVGDADLKAVQAKLVEAFRRQQYDAGLLEAVKRFDSAAKDR